MFTTVAIYMQILIGAVMRHLGAGLAIPDFPLAFGHLVPPFTSIYVTINFAHRCGAMVVTALVVWTVARVMRAHRANPILRRSALLLLELLFVQIILGALTIWTERAVIPATAHVAVGAGVLAASFALTVRVHAMRGRDDASEPATTPMAVTRSQVTA
jgi:cytochrome c oxidase assembly protein subunit 15